MECAAIKTIKAAKAAGYTPLGDLDYITDKTETLVVKGHSLYRNLGRLENKTEIRKSGRKVKAGEEPHATAGYYHGNLIRLYRRDQTEPLLVKTVKPAQPIDDVLAAIFTVNRSAKRYRDAAAACYESGAHEFAGSNRRHKEHLYMLKDRGMIYAAAKGLLTAVGKHGGLCLWTGNGYSFHSTLAPQHIAEQDDSALDNVFIEAKPKGAKEPRVKDAVLTLQQLPAVEHTFVSLPKPYRERVRNVQCWNCGEIGHISSECDEYEEEEWEEEEYD